VLYSATPKADGISALKVNGRTVTPRIVNGYATIRRAWKAGDKIEFVLPMKIQRVHSDERITGNIGRVALRYGPLVYNIEKVDQDIDGVLPPNAPLTTQWRGELLGGVTVITGAFANGAPMMAIPHYTRFNRNAPAPPPAPRPDAATVAANNVAAATAAAEAIAANRPLPRPAAPSATSIVWIRERA
jgi:hypothetical protein